MRKLENLHSYDEFVNENLLKKAVGAIRKGIGNKKIDKMLKSYEEKLMELNNQYLVARYGKLVKDQLFKTGKSFDQIAKEIGSETGKEISQQYQEAINNFKKTMTPQSVEGEDKLIVIDPSTNKRTKVTKRMVDLMKLNKTQIDLKINQSNIEKLKEIAKGDADIKVDDDVKNLQQAASQMTKDIEELNKNIEKEKKDEETGTYEVGYNYKYTTKDGKEVIIKIEEVGQENNITKATYKDENDQKQTLKDLVMDNVGDRVEGGEKKEIKEGEFRKYTTEAKDKIVILIKDVDSDGTVVSAERITSDEKNRQTINPVTKRIGVKTDKPDKWDELEMIEPKQ